MTYGELTQKLQGKGYARVERDDRLLDIFPKETREKGVELWENTTDTELLLVRVRLPYASNKLRIYRLPLSMVESSLTSNKIQQLDDSFIVATGEQVSEYL